MQLIREHLLFPDGARLIDRPIRRLRAGLQPMSSVPNCLLFSDAKSASMHVHAHLRYAEAMAVLGDAEALWEALQLANPIAVTDHLAQALPRQRNAYFSSSDAKRSPIAYAAGTEWQQVKAGTVGVEGGWRIYSSGPGSSTGILICDVLGRRRRWGKRAVHPLLPGGPQ